MDLPGGVDERLLNIVCGLGRRLQEDEAVLGCKALALLCAHLALVLQFHPYNSVSEVGCSCTWSVTRWPGTGWPVCDATEPGWALPGDPGFDRLAMEEAVRCLVWESYLFWCCL